MCPGTFHFLTIKSYTILSNGGFCGSSLCDYHAAVQENEGQAIAVQCAPNLVLPHPYISLLSNSCESTAADYE